MFKGAFQKPAAQPQPQPQYAPHPQYAPQPQPQYAPQPVAHAPVPQYAQPEDPEIAKLRAFFLKWLSIVIGGMALLLIVWRIVLKFF